MVGDYLHWTERGFYSLGQDNKGTSQGIHIQICSQPRSVSIGEGHTEFPHLLCHHLFPLLSSRPHCRMDVPQPICSALWESLGQPLYSLVPLTAFPHHTSASCFLLIFAVTYLPSLYVLVKVSTSISLFRISLEKQCHKTSMMCSIIQLLIPLFPSILLSLPGLRQPWCCVTVGDLPFLTFSLSSPVFRRRGSVNIHIHLRWVY